MRMTVLLADAGLAYVLCSPAISSESNTTPLTLDEVARLALERQPNLDAYAKASDAAREAAVAESKLPDPLLKFGAQNVPVNGEGAYRLNRDDMTMVTVGVMQEIALPANPLAEPDLNKAEPHEIHFQGGMMGNMRGATLNGRPLNMMQMMMGGKAWAVNGVVATDHVHDPVLTLKRGGSYRLTFINDTRWHHPIHLHGHSFRVIRRNGRPTPHREWQDTVLTNPQERVEVAFVADNPGDWMLHCHVLEHQAGGMMSVIRLA